MLTAIWLLPVLAGLLVALLPAAWARAGGLLAALVGLGLTVAVAIAFDPSHRGYQFVQDVAWVPPAIRYSLGVDGISIWMIVLNALLTVIAVAATPQGPRRRGFIALMLALEGAMAGVFLATDLLLFYVFWEAMLIPAYFLLWRWGEGERPGWAALKFVLYTLAGSLVMLASVIGEYTFANGGGHSFDLATLASRPPSEGVQFWLFLGFALAFAIKIPMFPFHSWLPDAYLSAPTALLVTFAGVMGKTGAYAMLRIVIPLTPHPVLWWDWNAVMPVLAVAAIIWGAFMALAQRDMKLLIAYSSVSHMGFIVLGIFSFNAIGQQGAVLQMVNHGVIVPALFLLVDWVAIRTGTRDRSLLAGLAGRMPVMAAVFLVVTLAALGLPGLNSFVGEFMTLLGAWQLEPWLAVAGSAGLVLAPVYMLRLFQGVFQAPEGASLAHGHAGASGGEPAAGPEAAPMPDIAGGELVVVTPLVLAMFALGLFPVVLTRFLPSLGFPLPVPWS